MEEELADAQGSDDESNNGPAEDDSEMIPDEPRQEFPDKFMLSCSKDCNILLHRLSNGVKIGQFGQDAFWNIFDMSQYDPKIVRPNYVREWIKDKKNAWKKLIEAKIEQAKKESLIPYDFVVDVNTVIKENKLAQIGLNGSMDSTGALSFGSEGEEQDTGGKPAQEFDDYDGLDANALEDSDDENMANQFKGALLRPDGARYQKKSNVEEHGTSDPRVKNFDEKYGGIDYLKKFHNAKTD